MGDFREYEILVQILNEQAEQTKMLRVIGDMIYQLQNKIPKKKRKKDKENTEEENEEEEITNNE